MTADKAFRVVGAETLFENSVLQWQQLEVETPIGVVSRLRISHPGAVAILALSEGRVHLIQQYRAAIGRFLLEIPAGTIDASDQDGKETAIRELEEEMGFRTTNVEHLFDFYTAPGFTNELMQLYLATHLTVVPRIPDSPEEDFAERVEIPVAEVGGILESGDIADAKTFVALQWLASRSL